MIHHPDNGRTMKLLRTLLIAALLALPAQLAAQVSVLSSTLEERQAAPGERYTGTLRVRNTSGEPQQARVYQTDYRFLADGRTFYEQPGSTPRSNAAWVRVNPSQLTLAPGEEAAVAYTVAVPADGAVRGSYWSVLMVETAQPPARASQRGVGITPSIRYAVQVATHVGQAERRIAFEGARLVGEAGSRALDVNVVNTGEQADRLELRVDLFDAEGSPAGRLTSTRGLVYPGTSIHQRFEFPALPAGTYRALLVVDTGADEVFGAEYTLRL
jgi:P pilus assembly chaperone PapD